jgi:hypothetical protein
MVFRAKPMSKQGGLQESQSDFKTRRSPLFSWIWPKGYFGFLQPPDQAPIDKGAIRGDGRVCINLEHYQCRIPLKDGIGPTALT